MSSATAAQGLGPAAGGQLERAWQLLQRAGPHIRLLRPQAGVVGTAVAKELFYRPLQRYADSLRARLAAWRRWESWWGEQQQHGGSVFAPAEGTLGAYLLKVSRAGPTASATAWHHLK